jgi:IS4 transposase
MTVESIEFELVALVAAVLVLLLKHVQAELYANCIGLSQVVYSKPILISQGRLGE